VEIARLIAMTWAASIGVDWLSYNLVYAPRFTTR
jgi:hypothetical protein